MKTGLVTGAILLVAATQFFPSVAREREEDKPEASKGKSEATVDCEMKFSLKGWSAFYKTAKGDGTITCSNGQSAQVKLKATGGGITFGKSEIIDGTGRFTKARNINELFGSYVQSEAHAGAGKSVDAQALTKGEISLTLVGS
ncbi:MAG TPA: hypothetical protein VFP98_06350, partial [Candidatus Polarisedimenticolia bacterium]|nr:hypothetical protein [Candidatus Polarisedimenticolia bacterium]